MRVGFRLLVVLALCGLSAATASALTLYGHSANSGSDDIIHVIDPATGVQIRTCHPMKGNGRGIVVVGTTGFFTVASSNNIYRLDINTCADGGIAFSVAGATGLSTIAYDGANFWIGDYSGTNKAFHYSPTGTLLATINLNSCGSFCDGLEYFNGKLISNRGDAINAPYDVYSLAGGAPTQAAFITPNFGATGIAYDGTDFFVSEIFGAKIHRFNGTTGAFIQTLSVTGGTGFLIEDLSFDYQQVLPTPTGTIGVTPTPTSPPPQVQVPTLNFPMLGLLALALAAAALLLIRR